MQKTSYHFIQNPPLKKEAYHFVQNTILHDKSALSLPRIHEASGIFARDFHPRFSREKVLTSGVSCRMLLQNKAKDLYASFKHAGTDVPPSLGWKCPPTATKKHITDATQVLAIPRWDIWNKSLAMNLSSSPPGRSCKGLHDFHGGSVAIVDRHLAFRRKSPNGMSLPSAKHHGHIGFGSFVKLRPECRSFACAGKSPSRRSSTR